jgi:hypothetical protein
MPETAENVAADFGIEREAQDRMALASHLKAVAAQKSGFFEREITPVTSPQKKGEAIVVVRDEHPRERAEIPGDDPGDGAHGLRRRRVRGARLVGDGLSGAAGPSDGGAQGIVERGVTFAVHEVLSGRAERAGQGGRRRGCDVRALAALDHADVRRVLQPGEGCEIGLRETRPGADRRQPRGEGGVHEPQSCP